MPHDAASGLGLHCLSVTHKEDPVLVVEALVPMMLYFCSDHKPLVTDFVVLLL